MDDDDESGFGRARKFAGRIRGTVGRREYLGAATVAIGGGVIGATERRSRAAIEAVTPVSDEAELGDAIGGFDVLRLDDDVTLTGPVRADAGTADVTIDLDGHVLSKADGTNAPMLDVRTEGDLSLQNGTIDCNRRSQDFPSVKTKEITVHGGRTCRVSDVTLLDNSNYGFNVVGFDEVAFENPVIDSRPYEISRPDDAAGVDGIHTFDCPRVRISAPRIRSGDDAVAVAANERSVQRASIRSGHLESPVHANGVRLHVQAGAAADSTVTGVEIDTDIRDCRGQGVVIANESANGEAIRDVTVSGVIRNARDGGLRALDRVENLAVTARISDVGANGVDIAGGGSAITVSSRIERAAVNGIHAVNASGVAVTDSIVRGCGNWPIISKGRSDDWMVVNNAWSNNRFSTVSLANEDNVVAFNRVGG